MFITSRCVALRLVKYDDKKNIVTAWSDIAGRISLAIPVGKTPGAKRINALMQPFCAFEGEIDQRPNRDISIIKDVRPLFLTLNTASDPYRAAVALFIAEVLDKLLTMRSPDNHITDLLLQAVQTLDTTTPCGVANFPILFMYRLASTLGIGPAIHTYQPDRFFNLADGSFHTSAFDMSDFSDDLPPEQAAFVKFLSRLSFDNASRLPLRRDIRNRTLDLILKYYTLHLADLSNLKALPVLRQLF